MSFNKIVLDNKPYIVHKVHEREEKENKRNTWRKELAAEHKLNHTFEKRKRNIRTRKDDNQPA